jgi:hypothetical protein
MVRDAAAEGLDDGRSSVGNMDNFGSGAASVNSESDRGRTDVALMQLQSIVRSSLRSSLRIGVTPPDEGSGRAGWQ